MPQPYTIAGFGGLDLTSSPDDSGCVDALNVDLDVRGAVRSRDGYAQLNDTSPSENYVHLLPIYDASTPVLLGVRNDTSVTAVDTIATDGTVTEADTWASSAATLVSVVRAGPATDQSMVFIASGTPTTRDIVQRYRVDDAQVSVYSGEPYYVSLSPVDNRLVMAGFNAADDVPASVTNTKGSLHTVVFSDPIEELVPTFSANSYIYLRPGDTEQITGAVHWRDLLIVFKQTAFFVFPGNTTNAIGEPEFNNVPVDSPSPIPRNFSRICVAGDRGVYYVATDGIYLTAGGVPVKVSQAVTPLFTGVNLLPFMTSSAKIDWGSQVTLGYAQRRLYVHYTDDDANARCLVLDEETGQWLLFSTLGKFMCPFVRSTSNDAVYPHFISGQDVFYIDGTATTDDGTAIVSRWRSGLYDLGSPGVEKRVTRTRLWGTGAVTWKTSKNWGSLSTGQSVTLGTSPAVDEGFVPNLSERGHLMSHEFSATSGAWRVHSLTHEVDGPSDTQSRTP